MRKKKWLYLEVGFEGSCDTLGASNDRPVLVQTDAHWHSIEGVVLNIVRVEHLTIYECEVSIKCRLSSKSTPKR